MITKTTALTAGETFNVANDFADLGLADLIDESVPLVKNVSFTIAALDTWLLSVEHPDGIAAGHIIISNETPPALSPGGFGGFAKMGCSYPIPIEADFRSWILRFSTGVLTADGLYTLSYSVARVP